MRSGVINMKLNILSGIGGKNPACMLLDTGHQQFLIDVGEGPEPGIFPDIPHIDNLAGIFITHDHMDHVDGLKKFKFDAPVYVTRAVAPSVPDHMEKIIIPEKSRFDCHELRVETGRSGHSLGGIWFHFSMDGSSFFYSGDFCLESDLFPFDLPPEADLAVLDASYGCHKPARGDLLKKVVDLASSGQCLLPVPPSGRALEISLGLCLMGFDDWSMDQDCWRAWDQLCRLHSKEGHMAAKTRLMQTRKRSFDPHAAVLIANAPCGTFGKSEEIISQWISSGLTNRHIIYSGYLSRETRAHLDQGVAELELWNVHPRVYDLSWLISGLSCRHWVPMFTEQGYDASWKECIDLQPSFSNEWML